MRLYSTFVLLFTALFATSNALCYDADLIKSLEACVGVCAKTLTSFASCSGVKDCICELVDDLATDVAACLGCVNIYGIATDLESLLGVDIDQLLLGCDTSYTSATVCTSAIL